MSQFLLKAWKQPPTLMQKMMGRAKAVKWVNSPNPPVGSEPGGFYAVALASDVSGTERAQIARALLWSDLMSKCYRLDCLEAYLEAAEAFPDDERCAFYVASLLHHGILVADPRRTEDAYLRLMNPNWRGSAYWSKMNISRSEVMKLLIQRLDPGQALESTPQRLALLESAFEMSPEVGGDRLAIGRVLANAYRRLDRSDDTAQIVYRFLFLNDPSNRENNLFLAAHFQSRGVDDANATAVYARAVEQAERDGDAEAEREWTAHLVQAFLSVGRIDAEAVPFYRRALRLGMCDMRVEASLAYAIALEPSCWHEVFNQEHLAAVVARAKEFHPYFDQCGWSWPLVARALACIWGEAGRSDAAAGQVYALATDLYPDEPNLWRYHAAVLAAWEEDSIRAIRVFEKAQVLQVANETVLLALGRAYLKNRVHLGSRRGKALAIWQTLYRQGLAWPELSEVLNEALSADTEAGEVALSLWEEMAQKDKANGVIRLRLARALRDHGDVKGAVRWYEEAAERMQDDFCTLLECGRYLKENTTDAPGVVRLLRRAVELPEGQRHLDAHFLLGEALMTLERREEAKDIFQRVVAEMDANHTQALLYLARLNLKYESEGAAAAEELYERAASQDPDNPETYRRMAEMYRVQGDMEMEQRALEKYLELSEPSAEQYRQLAHLYIRRGNPERAEIALRRVIALGEGDKRTYILLGEVLQSRSKVA